MPKKSPNPKNPTKKTRRSYRTRRSTAATLSSTAPKPTAARSLSVSRLYFTVVAVLIAIAGIIMLVPPQPAPTASSALQHVVTYSGQDGQNALDLLKAHHQVAAQQYSVGSYVTTIDGISAPPNYYWAFSVNGQPSQVGAGQYVTHNSDTLRWQLQRIQ